MKNFGKIKKILSAYLPPIIWAALIFFLSAQNKLPSAPRPILDLILKQGAHVGVYAILHFLMWRAIKITSDQPSQMKLKFIPLITVFLYALTDEFHQSFIPGREATWVDIGLDSIGIIISHYLTHRQKQIHSHTRL